MGLVPFLMCPTGSGFEHITSLCCSVVAFGSPLLRCKVNLGDVSLPILRASSEFQTQCLLCNRCMSGSVCSHINCLDLEKNHRRARAPT